jgi:translocator assembly and maintenance protein 41
VLFIRCQIRIIRDDPRVKLANQVNLASALRVALLTLPERFEERDLYERIAGLSYGGQSATAS